MVDGRKQANTSPFGGVAIILVIFLILVAGTTTTPFNPAFAEIGIISSTENDLSSNPPDPQIALDSGYVYSIWQSYNTATGGNDIVVAEKTADSTTFGINTVALTTNDLANPPHPRIAVDASNHIIYVVWQSLNSTSSSNDIVLAKALCAVPMGVGLACIPDPSVFITTTVSSTSTNDPTNPELALDDSGDIYVIWQEDDNIVLATSTNSGVTFDVNSIITSDDSSNPHIDVDGSNIYIAFQKVVDPDLGTNDIFFAKNDEGSTTSFSEPVNLSQTLDESGSPNIFGSGSGENVIVVWEELDPASSSTYEIFVSTSSDGGDDFPNPDGTLNLSNTPGVHSRNPEIGFSSDRSNLFLIWEEVSFVTLSSDIFVVSSGDGGLTMSCPTLVGTSVDFSGANSNIGADGATAYAVWEDTSTFSTNDIIFSDILDYQSPFITLRLDSLLPDNDFDGFPESRWGLESDAVTVSGRVANVAEGDSVTIEWGDGSDDTSTTTSFPSCSWQPISHTYGSSAVGLNEINAHLGDGTSATPLSIFVKSHLTALTLNPIASVKQNSEFTVSGQLTDLDTIVTDTDTAEGIPAMDITLDGDAADGLTATTVPTNGTGHFEVNGTSPDQVANNWFIQAHFAGDLSYDLSDSDLQFFNTINASAIAYDADAGENIEVPFADSHSVEFEQVDVGGNVYVLECNVSSDTTRFLAEGSICLDISPSVQLGFDSSSRVTMSFASWTPPAGYSFEDVDIFLEVSPDPPSYLDITESRDLDSKTVTGLVPGFGKFIGAVALHAVKPDNATRLQLYVGSNTITWNNPPTASLDKSSYGIGETATLTITDVSRNIDPNALDVVSATLTSSSDSVGITISLQETAANTGVFVGTFITTGDSSSSNALHVGRGDNITISYAQTPQPHFVAVIDNVIEAGVVDLTISTVDPDPGLTPFAPVSGAVDFKLVDAQVEFGSKVNVSLSYENVESLISDIGDVPNNLRLYQKDIRLDELGNEVEFWCEITLSDVAEECMIGRSNPHGVELSSKTVNGETTTISTISNTFSMGFDRGSPGGAGGGLGLPGAGVVLDFLAPQAISSASSSGGGHGSTSAPTGSTVQLSEGSNVEVTAPTSTGGNIEITFESIISDSGELRITENPDLNDYTDLFDSIESSRGKIIIPVSSDTVGPEIGIEYRTVGSIYDVDLPTDLEYSGKIWVTIPYDEGVILAAGGNEDKIRMLHYYDGGAGGGPTLGSPVQGDEVNAAGWEDVTASIDTEQNTISGYFGSLSPIALSITEDNTFGKAYFEVNPLAKILVSETSWGLPSSGVTVSPSEPAKAVIQAGQQVSVSSSIGNIQRNNQQFVYLVQVLDDQDIVHGINWQTGILTTGQDNDVSVVWTPQESGRYTVKIFVWDSLDSSITPSPLSTITTMDIVVGE